MCPKLNTEVTFYRNLANLVYSTRIRCSGRCTSPCSSPWTRPGSTGSWSYRWGALWVPHRQVPKHFMVELEDLVSLALPDESSLFQVLFDVKP
jgi:hypothetical protein